MSDRPAGSPSEFSSPAPVLFVTFRTLLRDSAPVLFRATSLLGRVAAADRFTQTLQPVARPRELDAKYREPNRNNNDCRSGCYQHNDANKKHGGTNHRNDNASCGLVCQMHSPFDQRTVPKSVLQRLILRPATVALPQ